MKNEINTFIDPLNVSLKELLCGTADQLLYQILELYECEHTGFLKAVIKTPDGKLMRKKIADIVNNMEFLEKFDKKTIRTLSYLAAIETTKPNYSIVSQQFGNETDEYLLGIRSCHGKKIETKSVREIFKNKTILSKFNPIDANQIGYLAGVEETVEEFNLKPKSTDNFIESIPAAIFWKDCHSVYLGCNSYMAKHMGLQSSAEIIGKTDYDLLTLREQGDAYRKDDKWVVDYGMPRVGIVEPLPLSTGTRMLLTSKTPLRDNKGNIYGVLGIFSEISERNYLPAHGG